MWMLVTKFYHTNGSLLLSKKMAASPRRTKTIAFALLFILGGAWLGLTAWLDFMLASIAYKALYTSSKWAQARGRILTSNRKPCAVLSNLGYDVSEVDFEYSAMGQIRKARTFRFFVPMAPFDSPHDERIVTEFAIGSRPTVWYDPSHPSSAVLSRELGGEFWFAAIVASSLTCVAGSLCLVAVAWCSSGVGDGPVEELSLKRRGIEIIRRKSTGLRPLSLFRFGPVWAFCDMFLPSLAIGAAGLLYLGYAFRPIAAHTVLAFAICAGLVSVYVNLTSFYIDPSFDIVLDLRHRDMYLCSAGHISIAFSAVLRLSLVESTVSGESMYSPTLWWLSDDASDKVQKKGGFKVKIADWKDQADAQDFCTRLRAHLNLKPIKYENGFECLDDVDNGTKIPSSQLRP